MDDEEVARDWLAVYAELVRGLAVLSDGHADPFEVGRQALRSRLCHWQQRVDALARSER